MYTVDVHIANIELMVNLTLPAIMWLLEGRGAGAGGQQAGQKLPSTRKKPNPNIFVSRPLLGEIKPRFHGDNKSHPRVCFRSRLNVRFGLIFLGLCADLDKTHDR